MKRWRVLGQLLSAPATAKREGSVATALLLLLVMGTAQARAFGPWPSPPPFSTEIEISEDRLQDATYRLPVVCRVVRCLNVVAVASGHRVRSVQTRELPPVRGPDLA